MKKTVFLIILTFVCIKISAQTPDTIKAIIISDKGDRMEMKIGDSTFSISYEYLYNDYVQKGVTKANEANFSGAISDFNLALLYKTNDPYAFYNRGLAFQSLNEFENAIEDYNTTIKLDSTFAQAFSQRGIAKTMLKKYDEAISDFLKSIKLKPDEAMYHYNTGIIYLQTGELDEACKYLQKAKEMGYPNAESLITQYCE